MKILFVENHAVFAAQVIPQFLARHEVTVVPTIDGAHRLLASREYKLVLCDYDLDDGEGDEVVREARCLRPRLPIIAVSSHNAGNLALMRAGANAVCGKMEFNRIEEVIASLVPADAP